VRRIPVARAALSPYIAALNGCIHTGETARPVPGAPFFAFIRLVSIGRRRPDMKIRNSLKSLRGRHRDNQLVRRKGRVYIINKTQKRYKARQG